jgi:hypothetical protein
MWRAESVLDELVAENFHGVKNVFSSIPWGQKKPGFVIPDLPT